MTTKLAQRLLGRAYLLRMIRCTVNAGRRCMMRWTYSSCIVASLSLTSSLLCSHYLLKVAVRLKCGCAVTLVDDSRRLWCRCGDHLL